MNKWEFARRDLLKSLGVGLAILPALRHTTWAAGVATPPKLLVFLASEGYRMAQWKPAFGPLGTLPQSMVPLTRHKDGLVVLSDMANPGYTGGVPDGHQDYGTIFWGGSNVGGSGKAKTPPAGGSTFDQFIAAGLPKMKYDSINFALQLEKPPKQTVVGQNRCFFKAGGAVTPLENPQVAYAMLYAGITPAAPTGGSMPVGPVDDTKSKQLIARKKSILDYIGTDLGKFKSRVAKEDQTVIDNHLSSIRDLEGTLSGLGSMPIASGAACSPKDPGMFTDADINAKDALWPDLLHAFMNMMIAGVSCDLTNVAGLQVADSTGDQVNFGAFVPGIPARNATNYKTAYRNWHDLGHNPNMTVNGVSVDHHRMVDEWCMNEFATYLDQVKAVPAPGGTLFDNSISIWANHMEDGLTHNSQKIPWILAGKAGGKLNGGVAPSTAGKNIQGAMADICTAMGVAPKDPFTGSIPGILKA